MHELGYTIKALNALNAINALKANSPVINTLFGIQKFGFKYFFRAVNKNP